MIYRMVMFTVDENSVTEIVAEVSEPKDVIKKWWEDKHNCLLDNPEAGNTEEALAGKDFMDALDLVSINESNDAFFAGMCDRYNFFLLPAIKLELNIVYTNGESIPLI